MSEKTESACGASTRELLASPDPRDFEILVEKLEDKYELTECVYRGAIKKFGSIRLSDLDQRHVERIIQPFLLTWGAMTRVLGYEGCKILGQKLKELNCRLEKFRDKDLSAVKLDEDRVEIKEIYENLERTRIGRTKRGKSKIIGPTATSKALHLAAPKFFVMWDTRIRNTLGFGSNGEEYIRFLLTMQSWIRKLSPVIEELRRKYDKFPVRLVDEYNWMRAHGL